MMVVRFFYLEKGGDKVLKRCIQKSFVFIFSEIMSGGDPDG
ncbi:hypothetical protein HMPREF1863_01337 [Aedoeadaptatus coxii]|uniref:Uncharacterized protein n=1 Tax=Aedoeadaptatus coxii TaxID=755172 RepID=A0A134AD19_9FIRM|nr:hypothetical protein HMPREF1863_01337 [Peptoniphilus coxii]